MCEQNHRRLRPDAVASNQIHKTSMSTCKLLCFAINLPSHESMDLRDETVGNNLLRNASCVDEQKLDSQTVTVHSDMNLTFSVTFQSLETAAGTSHPEIAFNLSLRTSCRTKVAATVPRLPQTTDINRKLQEMTHKRIKDRTQVDLLSSPVELRRHNVT